jgi:SAM-dependent methyltransferase
VTAEGPTAISPHAGSPERFGYEWGHYREMRPEYEEQFRGWTATLQPDDWRGKRFLDVGCGMGRNSFWAMSYGATGGLAIDVDTRSLAAARETLSRHPSVEVQQTSAYDLKRQDEFDIAFSIGVIHHLEFPELALQRMFAATKPGGSVLIWVYGLENNRWIVYGLTPLRRLLFSRLPIGWVHGLSALPTAVLWCALRIGIGRIAYFKLLRRLTFRHLRSIVFDQMLPRIAHYWPRETVERMMRDLGLENIRLVWVNEMSWSAVGSKPRAPTA